MPTCFLCSSDYLHRCISIDSSVDGQHNNQAASWSSFHLAFLLNSKWCNHTIVPTWLQLGRIPILFHQRDQISIRLLNQSIAVHILLMNISTLLSVDEILLPRYMNWSTNFRDLLFNEMAPS